MKLDLSLIVLFGIMLHSFVHEDDPKFVYNLTEARTKSRFEENDEDRDEEYGTWGPFSFRNWWMNTDLNA